MELALNEVKIQAKKLFKALKSDENLLLTKAFASKKQKLPLPTDLKLKDCITMVSHQLGFANWHHAHEVLSGSIKVAVGQDMGTLFYPNGADFYINEWFSDYQQAQDTLLQQYDTKWLLPYKSQFIVVKKDYISAFKLDKNSLYLWSDIQHDLVESYKNTTWDKLAREIIKNRIKPYEL